MPTSIVAPAIVNSSSGAAAIPEIMKLDPWFDWQVFLGLPFWFFIDIFFVLVVIVVFLYWVFRMKRLKSVKGYVDVLKKATQFDEMVWIINATRKLTIECMQITDGVLKFYDPANIIRWYHDERIPPLNIGGTGGVLCSEGYFRTRDMVAEIARDIACDTYNADLDGAKDDIKNSTGPITNYDDYEVFGRQNLETIHPNGLPIPSYVQFDPERDSKYKPLGLTSRFNGGIFRRDVTRLRVGTNVGKWYEKYIALGFIMVIVVISIMAAWMVPVG
jgi:hypothetical protein